MLRNWRTWILLVLLVGPVTLYVILGALWLAEHRGPFGFRGELLYYAAGMWIITGAAFSLLASRWTKRQRPLLPPLDWNAPQTFNSNDREAWELVQQQAAKGDAIDQIELTRLDVYLDTGRTLAKQLAAHYRPDASNPIEHVPVVELLTALQLAAEDLGALCREVPGGDLVTPAHWQKAVAAAGYLSRANEIYTFLLPLFQPVAGLARLGTQKLMVQPAWKDMQQNLLRWFFRAYVNRLGAHLVELYSGRLAIGATSYRRLSRKGARVTPGPEDPGPMVIAVAGAKGAGKATLIAALDAARAAGLKAVRDRLTAAGLDAHLADNLDAARLVEIPGYATDATARIKSRDRQALKQAADADFLLWVIDIRRDGIEADARFLKSWSDWFQDHPRRDAPPVLAVLTHADAPELAEPWHPPYDWTRGQRPRESAIRAGIERLRAGFPIPVAEVIPVGLDPERPFGVAESLLPALAALLHRAERAALLRHMEQVGERSVAGRLMGQISRQGRRLWSSARGNRKD